MQWCRSAGMLGGSLWSMFRNRGGLCLNGLGGDGGSGGSSDGGRRGNRHGSCCDLNSNSRRSNRSLRLDRCNWNFRGVGLRFARWRCNRRFDNHSDRRRHHGDSWTRRDRSSRSFSDNRAGRRAGSYGRRRVRRGHDGGSRPSLRNNLARLRSRRRRSRRRSHCDAMDGRCRRLGRSRGSGPHRCMAATGFGFLFLLFGQNSLHHIAGLGDVGEINLGCNGLETTRRSAAAVGTRPRSALEVRANLLGLMILNGTGVSLAFRQAELRQHVKDLTALDFHLACEIVDSNLTHPPLFKICYPKPLVAHSYLMALAAH